MFPELGIKIPRPKVESLESVRPVLNTDGLKDFVGRVRDSKIPRVYLVVSGVLKVGPLRLVSETIYHLRVTNHLRTYSVTYLS